MSDDDAALASIRFSNETGHELFQLLVRRAGERLGAQSDMERFTALLSAAVVPAAEVLRGPVSRGRDRGAAADKLIAIAGRQIRALLEDVISGTQS